MKIFDLHSDFLTKLDNTISRQRYLDKIQKYSEVTVCSVVWTSELKKDCIEEQLNKYKQLIGTKSTLAIEDLGFITPSNFPMLLKLNPFYCSLTWNGENNLGGGVGSLFGLSEFGKDITRQLQENDILVDTAHLSERSFLDIAKISTKPIFCSHTGFFKLQPSERNLKEYQIKIIIESGGIVGLFFVSPFLTGRKKSTIYDIASHIEYFCNNFDIDNLAIGSDFFGTKYLPQKLKNYSDFKNLYDILVKRGFTKEEIDKIFYKNAEEFYNRTAIRNKMEKYSK